MFFNSKSISDIATLLDELDPHTPIIVKGYIKINDAANRPNDPDAVFAFGGYNNDGSKSWVVWDFDPAQPAGTDNIDRFFDDCEIFSIETNATYDGEKVNAIIVYRDSWG